MASRNKKTTMAKLSRESKLRERRLDKQARKEARKHAAALDAAAPELTPLDETQLDVLSGDEVAVPEPSGAPRD